VRLCGRVNGAPIQWLTIFVSKRKEVRFQIKNLVVDLVAAIVHQANIASLKRAAISRQDWEVVIRTVPDVRRMPLLGEGRGTFRAVTVFSHRATIDVSVFHRQIIACRPPQRQYAFPSTAAKGGSGTAALLILAAAWEWGHSVELARTTSDVVHRTSNSSTGR